MREAPSNPSEGRHETEPERNDRNLVELLQEARVVVLDCSVFWYVMPLRRRRALRRGSALSDPHRLDPILPDRFDPDREAVR